MGCTANPNRPTSFELNFEGSNLYIGVGYHGRASHALLIVLAMAILSDSIFLRIMLQACPVFKALQM